MATNVIHLDFHRDKELTSLVDPCTVCKDSTRCTCEEAKIWWEEFAHQFKRQGIINRLGGE